MIHFTRDELIRSRKAQELGIDNTPPDPILASLDATLAGLERVRAALGHPMVISSGYRCPALNAAVGGSKTSQHMLGQAADFVCPAFGDPAAVVAKLAPMRRVLGLDQIILEATWIHVSFTVTPRYQVLRAAPGGKFERLA